jgi:hypothetical protein
MYLCPPPEQVQWHPLQHDEEMAALCRAHNVQLQAWSPLGGASGSVLSLPKVKDIAGSHNVSTAQVRGPAHIPVTKPVGGCMLSAVTAAPAARYASRAWLTRPAPPQLVLKW